MPFDRLPSNDIRYQLPQLVTPPPRPVMPWTQIIAPLLKSVNEAAEYYSPLGKLKRDMLMAQLEYQKRYYSGGGGYGGDLPYGYKWGKGPGGVPIPIRMNALEMSLLQQRGLTGARQAADWGVNTGTGGGWNVQGSLPPPQTQTPMTPKVDLTTPKFEGGPSALEHGTTPSRMIGPPTAQLYDAASDPNLTAHVRHEPDTSPQDYYDLVKLFTAPDDLNAVEPLPDEDKVMMT